MIFTWLGWNGTWLPLIVPHFFANAFNVFLLRQYFMTIPREMDEAAMIDGAGPFRILRSVIVPQSIPAITAVTLFHFFWAWNDFFVPLLYLANKPELQPLSIGIQQYNALYASQPTLIQASAVLAMAVPVVIFFLAQSAFMRGVVVTGRGQVAVAVQADTWSATRRGASTSSPGPTRRCRGSTTWAARTTSRSSRTRPAATRSTATPASGG